MVNKVDGELHQILLKLGYRFIASIELGSSMMRNSNTGFYVKDYSSNGGQFTVALLIEEDPYIELPTAFIAKYPKSFDSVLMAHVNVGGYLCYVEQKEADWDPNDLWSIYCAVDKKILETLNIAVNSVISKKVGLQEMEGEFAQYWSASENLYLLSEPDHKGYFTTRKAIMDNSESEKISTSGESVTFKDIDSSIAARWSEIRDLSLSSEEVITKCISVTPVKLSGMESWPPTNLKQVLSWLKQVDMNARNALLNHFIHKANNLKHIIILNVRNLDMVAFGISFNKGATLLGSLGNRNRRAIKLPGVEQGLSGKMATKNFHRLRVTRADANTFINRNRRRPEVGHLGSKNIAMIGCGTIGGYLSELLMKNGAGCGNGKLDLYDVDTLKPGNISRHILGAADCGQNKSQALVRYLTASSHLIKNINSIPENFKLSEKSLKKYDIVLDATGRPPVSKRLAYLIRRLPQAVRPLLIHGFNDGNGRIAKVFVDDGHACYGCLVADRQYYIDGSDMRFAGLLSTADKKVSCGNTFTTYDASVSVYSAGMMLEAALSCLEQERPWTYSEFSLEQVRSMRRQNWNKSNLCTICNGQH